MKKENVPIEHKVSLATSSAFYFTMVLASSFIILVCSALNAGFAQRSLVNNILAQDVVDSSGAILTSPSQSDLVQYQLHSELFEQLPVIGDGFVIDYDWSVDNFRVLLLEPYDTASNNFYLWKMSNYNLLDINDFVISDFVAPHDGPVLISVYPSIFNEGTNTSFTTVVYDQNGGNSVDTVYFGITGCPNQSVASGDNGFTGSFSNFFGAYLNLDGTGGLANQNPSDNCTGSIDGTPWTEFDNGSAVYQSNARQSATLNSVSTSTYDRILRVDWSVNLTNDFLKGGAFENMGYYFMAKDNSGVWNEGNNSGTWTKMGNVSMKSLAVQALDAKFETSFVVNNQSKTSFLKGLQGKCVDPGSLDTAVGCIPYMELNRLARFVITWATGIAGGLALLLMVYASFMIMTSQNDPERLKSGRELLTSAIAGLLSAILSVFILRLVGGSILQIF